MEGEKRRGGKETAYIIGFLLPEKVGGGGGGREKEKRKKKRTAGQPVNIISTSR